MGRTAPRQKKRARHAVRALVVDAVGARAALLEPGPPVVALRGRAVPVEPGHLQVVIAVPGVPTGAVPAGAAVLAGAATTVPTAAVRLARRDVASAAALAWALRWSGPYAGLPCLPI
jgi:hypothetical protein